MRGKFLSRTPYLPRKSLAMFEFIFEGRPIMTREGQSVAAALIGAGERCLRVDEAGNPKGALCAIGVWWGCRCSIDGVAGPGAGLTPARPGGGGRRHGGPGP